MNKSETIDKIAPALLKFQSQVHKISKDAKNPFHKNNYSTLDQIIEEIRPTLNENGLSVMQIPSSEQEGNISVKTILLHESGQYFESEGTTLKLSKNDPQGGGAGVTYARRYDLCAFLSLNTGDDDDGNSASGLNNQSDRIQSQTLGEIKSLWGEKYDMSKLGEQIKKSFKKDDVVDLTETEAQKFLQKLKGGK